MDFEFTKQEKMFQAAVRKFAEARIKPRAAEIDRTGQFPLELIEEMASLGYFGVPYPNQYGGGAAGYVNYSLLIEQLCCAAMVTGAVIAVNSLAEESLFRFGNEQQKEKFLFPLASGKCLGCFGFTEPATGSDPRAISTTARLEGKNYFITGTKNFVSLSPIARLAIIFAKDDTGRVSAFIADTSSDEFIVHEPYETLGLRGLRTSEVYLDNLSVPEENLLGKKGNGFEILLEAISVERLGVAAQSLGVAQAALGLSIDYARQRKALGKSIAELPTIQWLLAEMASRIEAARWLTYRVAFLRDRGLNIRCESAIAKLFASQMSVEVTRMAIQVHGSYGLVKTSPVERLYRDAKMAEVYVGVSEIQRVIIATHLLRQGGE